MGLGTEDHLDWIDDSVAALSMFGRARREVAIPECPGWTVGHVVDHVARSVGIGWAQWLQQDPDIDGLSIFQDLPPLDPGQGGQDRFDELMPRFVSLARTISPDQPTFFWSGPATAARLLQWTATEIGVHLSDISRATQTDDAVNTPQRVFSGVEVTTAFFSEIWERRRPDIPVPPVVMWAAADLDRELLVGSGSAPEATARGRAIDLLRALFGRTPDDVTVDGDINAFEAWCFDVSSPVE